MTLVYITFILVLLVFVEHVKHTALANVAYVHILAYLVRHHSMKNHPSPHGHGWELVNGKCRPVHHTRPSLPINVPASGQADEEDENESQNDRE